MATSDPRGVIAFLLCCAALVTGPSHAQDQQALTRSTSTSPEISTRATTAEGGSSRLEEATQQTAAFRRSITEAYRLVTRYIEMGGHDIRIAVSDFETIFSPNFGEVYYADIATLPDGEVLDLLRVGRRDEINLLRTVHYKPSWRVLSNDWAAFAEGARMLSMRVDEILREVSAENPEYRDIEALTRFQVDIEDGDKKRSYRAAFLWQPGSTDSEWSAVPVDHILSGVGQVLNETVPVEGISLAPLQEDADISAVGAPIFLEECKTSRRVDTVTREAPPGTNGHLTGYHIASVDFTGRCSCSSDCSSSCVADVRNTQCEELDGSTIWTACHHFAQAFNATSGNKADAGDKGAECAAGFSCAQKACQFCLCSLSTQVTIAGLKVSFSPTDADWTANYQATFECPACEVDICGSADGCTPVLVSLQNNSFELTGLEDSIFFDLDADGDPERLSWTVDASDDALLALDRNHNGMIDDGGELFGDVTPQPSAADPNGFRALAVFDQPENGGDSDGLITANDAIFSSLVLWLDRNHDGISQSGEMSSLAAQGITGIELDYVTSERRDRHGNRLRWASLVHFGDQKRLAASDAILLVASE